MECVVSACESRTYMYILHVHVHVHTYTRLRPHAIMLHVVMYVHVQVHVIYRLGGKQHKNVLLLLLYFCSYSVVKYGEYCTNKYVMIIINK